ncbi:alkaline phosphatase family protein [Sphingomonas sp.]
MRILSLFAAALLAGFAAACTPVGYAPNTPVSAVDPRPPVTILVSIDGFHPDYLARGITPNLSALAAGGVSGSLRPSFPTKTFPNHYALVTGLHPDRNGIVANRFEDPRREGEVFTMATTDPFWWDEAEPLWVAAEKAGIRTATMFWPGSNSPVHGTYPSDWQQFAQALPERNRVDAIIDWLRRPAATRPRFLTLYFDTVDTAGHRFGPDAPETAKAIADADALIGRLRDELATLGQPANLVIASDHGMAPISADRVIDLYEQVARDDIRLVEDGPYASFHALPGREATVRAAIARPHPNMQCWPREAIPARLAYGRNPRVPPFLCLAKSGWTILGQPPRYPVAGGTHGYDNADPAMNAVFLAHGPSFRAGTKLPIADSVDVYALVRRLIGLPPKPGVDGRLDPLAPALAE